MEPSYTGQLPKAFMCTFTDEPLIDPVVTCDGHTYSRAPIEHWFRKNPLNPTSPKTNEKLNSTVLVPNVTVRQAMDEIRERQPMALDPDLLSMNDPEELLGEGSYGRVVAGTLALGGKRAVRVAVKKLPAMTAEAERVVFQQELKAFMHAARHCDGICVLYGTCEINSRICIVMKRYEQSLHSMITKAGRLEVALVRRYSHSLFRILGQLHESGMVVRDIKPDNILVDTYGDLVLSDFGISEVMHSCTHVQQSQMKGTFAYMSPEAFSQEKVGPPVDIWAMGCVVLQMHTGTPPWNGLQMQQIMFAVCVDKRVPQVPEDVPAADMLRRCFGTPADRPKADQLVRAFAPTFEPPAAVSAVARLEQQCGDLQQRYTSLEQRNADLEQQLQAQQEITEQVTAALTAKTLEVEQQAATIVLLNRSMVDAAELAARIRALESDLRMRDARILELEGDLQMREADLAETLHAAIAALNIAVRCPSLRVCSDENALREVAEGTNVVELDRRRFAAMRALMLAVNVGLTKVMDMPSVKDRFD